MGDDVEKKQADKETRPFLSSSFFKTFASLWRSILRTGNLICISTTIFVSSHLSRALLRAGLARNALSQVRPVSTTSAKAGSIPAWVDGVDIFENEKNPERDHVNFPRRKREELPSPVRHW